MPYGVKYLRHDQDRWRIWPIDIEPPKVAQYYAKADREREKPPHHPADAGDDGKDFRTNPHQHTASFG